MLEVLLGVSLVAATVAMGLLAGLFYAFTVAVMPGLRRADGRTFVAAMQHINEAILTPWFFISFFGAPVLTVVAALVSLGADGRAVLAWTVAAAVLCGAELVITIVCNVPLNNALAAAGPPDGGADLTAVRERFEAAWVRWNLARTIACTAALGCLAWALVLYGRMAAAG